jgi:hypothetical protein
MIMDDDGSAATNSLIDIRAPGTAPLASGSLRVVLEPALAVGQWRFPWEAAWKDGGNVVTGLVAGNYEIEFKAVSGYIQPPPVTVVVETNVLTSQTNYYVATQTPQLGALRVILKPDSVMNDAFWRRQGETTWHSGGETVSNLNAGTHLVEFSPLTGRSTPASRAAEVAPNQLNSLEVTYLLSETAPGTPPSVLQYSDFTAGLAQGWPYAYNGQIRSDVGYGSGFVVKERVVLTAAHVVFNDANWSFVTEVYWFFQQHRGSYEPKPQQPRGWYVFEGYAARRMTETTPGTSSPAAQNLDVAALYFLEPAGRGGYGGYLSSDAEDHVWLTAARPKMLVGYPVEVVVEPNRGKMHATPAAFVTFAKVLDKVYATTAIQSYPGNSGGPLCVQSTNNAGQSVYYPAAVYLGGSGQTVVRAIDSGVLDLINRAESSANTGGNNSGGGVVLLTPGTGGGLFSPGYLKVELGPQSAIDAGAGWRLVGHPLSNYFNNNVPIGLLPGGYTVEFKAITGYAAPANLPVQVVADQTAVITGNYMMLPPGFTAPLRGTNGVFAFGLIGQPGTIYLMEATTNLGQTNWLIIATNIMDSNGVWQFTDPASTNLPNRYYRARQTPNDQ